MFRWVMIIALVGAFATGCDKGTDATEVSSESGTTQTGATPAEVAETTETELPDTKTTAQTTVTEATETEPTQSGSESEQFEVCEQTVQGMAQISDRAERTRLVANACGPLLSEESCASALESDHETFWTSCLDVYCPTLKADGRTSIACETKGTPVERAFFLPVRAAFMADVITMERGLAPIDDDFQQNLRDMLTTPPEDRHAAMQGLVRNILTSDQLTADQKKVWTMSLVLSTLDPISPPPLSAR